MLKENLKSVKTWGDGDNTPFDLFPLYTTKKIKATLKKFVLCVFGPKVLSKSLCELTSQ